MLNAVSQQITLLLVDWSKGDEVAIEQLNAKDAAEKPGVSDRRIRAMIKEGKIKAANIGGGYVIEESELKTVKVQGKAGRPKKETSEKS